ncbi:MAG TPA: pyroglutamyl-peptidase I [Ramlibacter sp.]|nr:pyroglutamyl-peptidase I [Ramlibacter sp.]
MVAASDNIASGCPSVLVTGFEPFGPDNLNPSWMAAQALHGRMAGGHRIIGAQLPTVFGAAIRALRDEMMRHKPVLVLAVGQAGGRSAISLERVAINVNDARIPDNAGAQPVDTAIVAGAPAAYFTTLPIKAMLKALLDAGIAAEVSQTAGTFVCNHVFYGLMHELATSRQFKGTRGGFVHVPYLPAQGQPSMPLDRIVAGLKAGIECALKTHHDIRKEAGALN